MDKIYRVVDINLDTYVLSGNNEIIEATIRGNVKKKDSIIVGDMVKTDLLYDKYVITDILQRKNQLIRPRVSNIDNLVIVTSIKDPTPDYTLLDKQIILCFQKNITPIICINKTDLVDDSNEDIKYINKVYGNLGIKIVYTSTINNEGIDNLKEELKGKISAFSGNSGVGKSSLTKMYVNEKLKTNDVAMKTKRGRHTTKKATLFEIDKDTYILDTPGFSSYELFDLEPKKLKEYYPEFENIFCDFADCNHVNEDMKVCKVKQEVNSGNIDKLRYDRYVFLYTKLKEVDDRKYK